MLFNYCKTVRIAMVHVPTFAHVVFVHSEFWFVLVWDSLNKCQTHQTYFCKFKA